MSVIIYNLKNVAAAAKENAVFVDSPCYSKNGRYRMLQSDAAFRLSDGKVLEVRAGMYWDENSIPLLLQWAFPKSGMYAIPALVHDALYFDTGTSQRYADDEFRHWMRALCVSKRQVWFRYWAVRLFGHIYWDKNKKGPGERCLHNRRFINLN